MKQAIVILIKNQVIEKIRMKYDPQATKIQPHITLAFPFENINQVELYAHVRDSIKKIKKFKLVLKGVKASPKKYYLYLLVKKGKKEILGINKNLYSKLLTKWLRKDIPYIPHLTLGVFKSKQEIDNAIEKLEKEGLEFNFEISSIQLITLNQDISIKSVKNFSLH